MPSFPGKAIMNTKCRAYFCRWRLGLKYYDKFVSLSTIKKRSVTQSIKETSKHSWKSRQVCFSTFKKRQKGETNYKTSGWKMRWILLWMAVANKALNEAEDWGVNDCSTKCTTTSHDRGISYPGWNSILGGHWFESRQFSAFFGLNNQSRRRSRWCHNPLKYRTVFRKISKSESFARFESWEKHLMIDMGTWLNKQTGADSNYLWRKRPLGHCSSSRNDNTTAMPETTFRHYVVNSLKFHSYWCQDQSKCVSSHMIFSGLTQIKLCFKWNLRLE